MTVTQPSGRGRAIWCACILMLAGSWRLVSAADAHSADNAYLDALKGGIHDDAVMPGMRPEQWSRVIDVSLNGFFNVTQPLLMPMIGTRWGRIVNVSSVAALAGNRGQTNYAAAKAGLHGATKALALELASRGITVNAVAPGIIASSMTETVFPQDAVDRLVPMKRAGTPEEVADLIGFLASERAAYISGQIISINGAMI